MNPIFELERKIFHRKLLGSILTTNAKGIVSNADGNNGRSCTIAKGIAELLEAETVTERAAGQTSGNAFEAICSQFVESAFKKLNHLRPGDWNVRQIGSRNRLEIANYQQYAHLVALAHAAENNPELAAALGSDYTITPDIIVTRDLVDDEEINRHEFLVDNNIAKLASLRKNNVLPLLHASISCKWTIRSDRAQNARSEGLNLVRNRKGRLPHVVVVTAEPTPSRISSIALGTGEIDCVYHFALYELEKTLQTSGYEDALDLFYIMVNGKRLKDISDLPLDLAI
ncbi:restriction endonuclease [Neisseria brasiliensis]|uniref:NgoMIV family type II restriction endonuclease n=1 Tax=Neisseria TaxID=482 RepID=UPI000C274CFC|nr:MULTISPECIES: NgoMIV family type II restriction endonuclease [Neisseria]PJO78363.1 restriction endonuclease [Neisseria sp. N177_16]QGL24099.1 restriction endonuclease [Neisseria brasiliensis]